MITLKKAIEVMELNIKEAHKNMPPDVLDALKLMVEAGKCIIVLRMIPDKRLNLELSGEAKERNAGGGRPLLT